MKNALAKRARNALSMGYMGPTGFNDAQRANALPSADGLRKAAEVAASSQIPGIADAASGVLAADDARRGNWGQAGLNALGLLPFVPAMGGMFIGKGAKTWDALQAAEAQKLLDAGADPREVWQKTGTFKGADGALRQEIDDSAATFNAGALRDFHNETALVRQGRMMNHPELSAAYPDVASVAYRKQAKTGASYEPDTDTVYLAQGAGDPRMSPEARDLLTKSPALHELQHAIQQREGWASGGSPDMAFRDPRMWGKEGAAGSDVARKMLADKIKEIRSPLSIEDYARSAWGQSDITPELIADYQNNYLKSVANIDPRIEVEAQKSVAQDWYRSLAGEAEARVVQKRMKYPMDQRRAVYPFDDYDVPVNSLIVRTIR